MSSFSHHVKLILCWYHHWTHEWSPLKDNRGIKDWADAILLTWNIIWHFDSSFIHPSERARELVYVRVSIVIAQSLMHACIELISFQAIGSFGRSKKISLYCRWLSILELIVKKIFVLFTVYVGMENYLRWFWLLAS